MAQKQQTPQSASGVTHATVPLDALHPHPRNYRQHPESQIGRLAASLARFGQVRSVVVQAGADGRYLLVAGHGLAEAAKREGLTELHADVIPPHWTPEQIEGYLIADNESSREADDDLTQLAAMLEEQRNAGYHLESLGFSDDDLTALLEQLAEDALAQNSGRDVDDPDGGGDDFDTTPDESGPTRCQPGDLWQLGKHRLLCGDSTKREDHDRVVDRQEVDLVLTDPPYGVGIEYASFNDTAENVRALVDAVMPLLLRWPVVLLTPGIPAMWHYPQPTWLLAWVHPAASGSGPWGFASLNPILAYGGDPYLKAGLGRRADALTMVADRKGVEGHPVAKPLVVWSWLLERGAPNEDATVFDPFMGSGTTIIACERLGRTCYGIELDPCYCDVILRRWEAETGREAVLLERLNVSE